LENKLSPEEAAVLEQLIAANPGLQEQVAWLQEFLQISRTTVLATPPATVRQAAHAAFAAYANQTRPPSLLRTLIASLAADNWQRPALASARNISLLSEPRQLIYSSDLADVALNAHMQIGSQQVNLDGQIFPLDDSDPADFIAQLLQNGLERGLAFADALGKFSLTGLTPGHYDLLISRAGVEIEVGPLELG
jgi:anti-sigma factor RsiW